MIALRKICSVPLLRSANVRSFSSKVLGRHPITRKTPIRNLVAGCQCIRELRIHIEMEYDTPFEEGEAYDIHLDKLYLRSGPVVVPNNEVEFLIIGGGIMGLAVAYNLWRKLEILSPLKASKYLAPVILCVEKDTTLNHASTPLSVGGIRQQFSHPSNIRLSMMSAQFLRDIRLHLGVAGHDDPDVQFQPQGYLMLASENGADQLMRNYQTQIDEGAKVMLLSQKKLKEIFPWLNVDDIELATYGLENEGWFDPWALVNAFKTKLTSLGVRYLQGEVVGFKKRKLDGIVSEIHEKFINLPDGTQVKAKDYPLGAYVKFPDCDKPVFIRARGIINCAGAWSNEISKMMGIGVDSPDSHPILQTELPVRPRKRYVYVFHCPDGPIYDCPLLVDPSTMYFRREGFGGNYVCGIEPPDKDNVDHSNLEVDYDLFYDVIWPKLAHRVPVFEKLKLKSAWAGYYDYNTFDQNAIIGPHPYYPNFCYLTGFSGHGLQQAFAASSCLAEIMVSRADADCKTIDVDKFSFNRIIDDNPMLEVNII